MHRVQVIRVTFCVAMFAAFLDVSLGDARLPLTCKNIARDVIMNSCKGPRIKRDAAQENVKEAKEAKEEAKGDVVVDSSEGEQSQDEIVGEKRQWGYMNTPAGGYGNLMQDVYHNTHLQLPGLDFTDNQGSQIAEQVVPSYPEYPSIPYGYYGMQRAAVDVIEPSLMSKVLVLRSPNAQDILGYDLSSEELEELHQEIGERMPRNSKDLNKKIFLNVAAKCCPNAKLCYENPSLIPCMLY